MNSVYHTFPSQINTISYLNGLSNLALAELLIFALSLLIQEGKATARDRELLQALASWWNPTSRIH